MFLAVSHVFKNTFQASQQLTKTGVSNVCPLVSNAGQTGELTAGANAVSWSIPERMGSGIYFVRASMNGQTVSSRMTVVR